MRHILPLETTEGVRIDLIWAQLPYEHRAIAQAATEDIGGIRVQVCRAEDLIIHKLVSDRPKDRLDIRGIIHRQGSRLDRRYLRQDARQLAQALDRPELLKFLNACFSRRRLDNRK